MDSYVFPWAPKLALSSMGPHKKTAKSALMSATSGKFQFWGGMGEPPSSPWVARSMPSPVSPVYYTRMGMLGGTSGSGAPGTPDPPAGALPC